MHDFFRYKMTESSVQEIKLPSLDLNSFIRELESKHGKILTLSELCAARNQKLGNEIILVSIVTLRVFGMLKVIFGPKEQEVRFKPFGTGFLHSNFSTPYM
jgi:hypothetical protein